LDISPELIVQMDMGIDMRESSGAENRARSVSAISRADPQDFCAKLFNRRAIS
jgi:hypothetical protein